MASAIVSSLEIIVTPEYSISLPIKRSSASSVTSLSSTVAEYPLMVTDVSPIEAAEIASEIPLIERPLLVTLRYGSLFGSILTLTTWALT